MNTKLFSYNFSFFIWSIPLMNIIGIKSAHGNYEYNFKKVGAISCGFNNKWTAINNENIKSFGEIYKTYVLNKYVTIS